MVQGRGQRQQPDGFFAVWQGFIDLTTFQQHLAQIRASQRVGRVELDCSAEMHERFIHAARLAEQVPQVVVG